MAADLLFGVAKRVSGSINTFSGWMITAYAAAFSLVFSKFPEVSTFVSPAYAKFSLTMLVFAFVLELFVRLMAAQLGAAIGSQ
jgi:hypothetical protein